MKRGEIRWASIDKRRPVLILSPDVRNERASDLIVAILSTRPGPRAWMVPLGRREGGLTAQSFVRGDQLFTVRKEEVDASAVGSLSRARLIEIERAVMSALGIELDGPA